MAVKQIVGFVVLVVFLGVTGAVEGALSGIGAPGVIAWPVGVIAGLLAVAAPSIAWNRFRVWRLESKPGVRAWEELDQRAFELQKKGDLAAARPLYEQALPAAEATGQPVIIATAANNLAGLYVDEERWGDAEPLFARAYELRKKAIGPANELTLKTAERLSVCEAQLGRWAQVEALQREVLPIYKKASDATDATVETLRAIGVACRHQSRYEDAGIAFGEAERLLKREGELKSELAASLYNDWAYMLNASGSPAAALPVYDRAIAIRQKGEDRFQLAQTLDNRADAQTALHDFAGAAETSQRWFELMDPMLSAQGVKGQAALVPLLEHHAGRLEAAGRSDEAARLRARAEDLRARHPEQVAEVEAQIAST